MCMLLKMLCTVFKRKVLELHHKDTYGDDASTGSSDDSSEHCNPHSRSPVTTAAEPTTCTTTSNTTIASDQLDQSVQEALGVLTAHRRFLDRQSMLADQHRKRNLELPRTVSSKRAAESANMGEEKEEGGTKGKEREGRGQREVTQAEKNRKRKLKKRKAREKRFKLQDT